NEHHVRPGEIGGVGGAKILIDEADRPSLGKIGGNDQEPLRRHEGAHAPHQPVGVRERAKRMCIRRENAQDSTLVLDCDRTTHTTSQSAPRRLRRTRIPSVGELTHTRSLGVGLWPKRPMERAMLERPCKLRARHGASAAGPGFRPPTGRICAQEQENMSPAQARGDVMTVGPGTHPSDQYRGRRCGARSTGGGGRMAGRSPDRKQLTFARDGHSLPSAPADHLNIFWKNRLLGTRSVAPPSSRSTMNMRLRSMTRPLRFSGKISTVSPRLNGRQTTRKRLAVMLLTIAQVARNPTPTMVAAP